MTKSALGTALCHEIADFGLEPPPRGLVEFLKINALWNFLFGDIGVAPCVGKPFVRVSKPGVDFPGWLSAIDLRGFPKLNDAEDVAIEVERPVRRFGAGGPGNCLNAVAPGVCAARLTGLTG